MKAPPISFEHEWQARHGLADAVARIAVDATAAEGASRKRQRRIGRDSEKFAACLAALVCNFAAIALVCPGRSLATARRTRSAGSELHGKTFIRALDAMEAAGFIEQQHGSWSRETYRHEISRSVATAALLNALPAGLSADCLGFRPGPGLELRSRRDGVHLCDTLPVPNTMEAKLLAAQVDLVNVWLTRADVIRRDGVDLCLHEPEARLPSVTNVRAWALRRVFNNGTLAHGGRLAGGWWLGMSQRERADLIRIDGEQILELDFVCMVPRLCYALHGIPWPFGNDADTPYVCGPAGSRGAWKKWVNSMLFANRSMGAWVGKTREERMTFAAQFDGMGWQEARALVLRRHAALDAAGGFGCELGMEAMRAESDIAVDVVLRLAAQGITCLPIHDGFAVATRHEDAVRAAMIQASEARVGVPLIVCLK